MKARIIMESTGIYHCPLFCYLRDRGFDVIVINPIISKNSTNLNIRKVENDKFSSRNLALIGLKPDLKTSVMPPDALLAAKKSSIVNVIAKTARFGKAYAEKKYHAIVAAAEAAATFAFFLPSNSTQIRLCVSFIQKYDTEFAAVLALMHKLVNEHAEETFAKQIRLIETIPGVVFLSEVTVMCEIGDFYVFKSPNSFSHTLGLTWPSNSPATLRAQMSKRLSAASALLVLRYV